MANLKESSTFIKHCQIPKSELMVMITSKTRKAQIRLMRGLKYFDNTP
jgi:hypothetical protein